MRSLFTRKALYASATLLLPALAQAQYMETFEGVTASGSVKPVSFTSNGQTFNILTNDCVNGGTFGVFVPGQNITVCSNLYSATNNANTDYGVGTACTGGSCSGFSAKFIDNGGGPGNGTSQIYSIKTANAALFTIKSLFIYLSADHSITPSAAGGVTFRGKVNGSTVFTMVKTTGFNTSFSSNQGFTYVDFAGNGNVNIDELEIQGGASANYVAIDNFTFGASVPLPVTLAAFSAVAAGNAVKLEWRSASEVNCLYYEIERSAEGRSFSMIGKTEAGKGIYTYYDRAPVAGNSLYRLRMVDRDGSTAYSPVAALTVPDAGSAEVTVFPNPAVSGFRVTLQGAQAARVVLRDIWGKVVLDTQVRTGEEQVSLQGIAKGLYLYRITAAGGTLLAQGKLIRE